MGVEGLTEDAAPDFAQLQKDALEREERQKKEKDEARRARQVRLGHVEEDAPKPKPRAKTSAKAQSDPAP